MWLAAPAGGLAVASVYCAQPLPKAHGCQLVVVAHAPQFEADDLDAEFGYAVEVLSPLPTPKSSLLSLRDLPAVERMAVCVRVGPPEEAHAVTGKIGRFVAADGDVLDGPSREVFLQPPDPSACMRRWWRCSFRFVGVMPLHDSLVRNTGRPPSARC